MSSSDQDDAPDGGSGGEDSPLFHRRGPFSADVAEVPVSQSLIKVASNVCFSLFVLAVLVVTVVAVTYQPPDPWLQSSTAITTSLSRVLSSSTFLVPDDSLLPTVEDFNSLSSSIPAPAWEDLDDSTAVPPPPLPRRAAGDAGPGERVAADGGEAGRASAWLRAVGWPDQRVAADVVPPPPPRAAAASALAHPPALLDYAAIHSCLLRGDARLSLLLLAARLRLSLSMTAVTLLAAAPP